VPGDETASPLPEMTRRMGVWGQNHISSPRDDLVSPRRPAIQLREEYLHTLHVSVSSFLPLSPLEIFSHIALAHTYPPSCSLSFLLSCDMYYVGHRYYKMDILAGSPGARHAWRTLCLPIYIYIRFRTLFTLIKIGKKGEKNRGSLVMMLGGSGSSVHFQIWKHLHFLMKNGYKIDQKIGKVVSIVRGCFQGPGTCPKMEIWMFLMKEYQKNQKKIGMVHIIDV